jgi:hypothetical protein
MNRWSTAAIALLVIGFTVIRFAPEASGQADPGWITLLEGPKMGDWDRIGDANWHVADGVVVADKNGGKDAAYLVSKANFKDFSIRAEFWADEEANSGIFLRCDDPAKVSATVCYEVNIYDKRPDPSYGTGAIVNVAKVVPMPKAAGKWNTYEITAQGSHLVVVLNGVKTVDVEDGKHASGPFALQYASGVIKFRKVQIKPL